ncbi:MAG: patatin-like phospholipase family protein [Nocardioidaceae bacterium]
MDTGPSDRAIRASISIPGCVTPVAVNGRLLVDGGVLNPVPVAATATSHADLVVAVSLQGQRRHLIAAAPTRESADRRPAAEWWGRFRSHAAGILSSDALDALAQRVAAPHTRPTCSSPCRRTPGRPSTFTRRLSPSASDEIWPARSSSRSWKTSDHAETRAARENDCRIHSDGPGETRLRRRS